MTDIVDDSVLARPNSYIGRSLPRPDVPRLLRGAGKYTDDLKIARMVHVAFVRSPYAHARIGAIDATAALGLPGVLAVYTGADLAEICEPWVGTLTHIEGLKSAPQYPMAVDRATWQGEAVAAVIAESRAEAEDGVERVRIDFDELEPVVDPDAALAPGSPLIHPELGDNLAYELVHDSGDVDTAFANAALVLEERFEFARHTGVTLEPRVVVAEFDAFDSRLTVHISHQAPHMMQHIFARHLGVPESNVRVVCRNVGGGFGIKVHAYGDEMATVALAKLVGRPVKFTADRIESFASDIHARSWRVDAKLALDADGVITAVEYDGISGIGPYSVYPRSSAVEARVILFFAGSPYRHTNYRGRVRVVFQNKNAMCQYRSVGSPIAFTIVDSLLERGARELGIDPLEIRRRNVIADDAYPAKMPSGVAMEGLSHQAAIDKMLEIFDNDGLKADRDALRAAAPNSGRVRGIGFCTVVEVTNPGAAWYGAGGAHISSQDGATVRMDASGSIIVATSGTEQGQGHEAITAQIAASAFGVDIGRVRVISGDTDIVPYGGGAWASRATGIAGEAILQAAKKLRINVIDVAAPLLQTSPESLDIQRGRVVDAGTDDERLTLEEVAKVAYFRPDLLPGNMQAELVATAHFVPRKYPLAFTNGLHACQVEVDTQTGEVAVLGYWVVEDCGTIINPQLVAEQVRGGVVQGLGGALMEECHYDANGQLLNANMVDYLVPMAGGMPDIVVAHCSTPTAETELGAKGAGEAGTGGAPTAVMNAINDALAPLGARMASQPITPEKILRALGHID
jgi:carbon-monoxide dehydrogenase large subunit